MFFTPDSILQPQFTYPSCNCDELDDALSWPWVTRPSILSLVHYNTQWQSLADAAPDPPLRTIDPSTLESSTPLIQDSQSPRQQETGYSDRENLTEEQDPGRQAQSSLTHEKCHPQVSKSSRRHKRKAKKLEFQCSYQDCVDKNTGFRKKFKRREHQRRHEKTVHEKQDSSLHKCWVPQCGRSFSRTDNLRSHLRNTHGRRSETARNRYVATLDPTNTEYFSPNWTGELSTAGLPISEQ